MELLIVLGLCFGAYELLGVFQGCFHYNDHPLPYQPQAHGINSALKSSNNSNDTKENDNDNNEESNEDDENKVEKDENYRRNHSKTSIEDEENLDSLKSGPCSCHSTVTEDEYDDDTRIILRSTHNSRKARRQQIFQKQINKFSLSTSLMSLSRDDTNFLFNYIDNVNNKSSKRFTKFKSEAELFETSFSTHNNLSKHNEYNDIKTNKTCHHNCDALSSDLDETPTDNNEDIDINASVNLDSNKKKIFFISAAS